MFLNTLEDTLRLSQYETEFAKIEEDYKRGAIFSDEAICGIIKILANEYGRHNIKVQLINDILTQLNIDNKLIF